MSKSIPVKPQVESTHSASFCSKNHQIPSINKKTVKDTVFHPQNLGITPLKAMRILYDCKGPKTHLYKSVLYGRNCPSEWSQNVILRPRCIHNVMRHVSHRSYWQLQGIPTDPHRISNLRLPLTVEEDLFFFPKKIRFYHRVSASL